MARLARVVAIEAPHHITQRGNARQTVFEGDPDRLVYLDLLCQYCRLDRLKLLGYCLMSNHIHLIAIPARPESMPLALKHTHERYAGYFNARHASSGHVWQGRYYSCPLDREHLWTALRYAELNPVRAGMVAEADQYPWSSAEAHCADGRPGAGLDMEPWRQSWDAARWREYLHAGGAGTDAEAIRRSTHAGRPLGTADFVADLERALRRPLAAKKGGRPPKKRLEGRQEALAFEMF
jgi:putative transposase